MFVYKDGGCQTQGCLMFRLCTKDFVFLLFIDWNHADVCV